MSNVKETTQRDKNAAVFASRDYEFGSLFSGIGGFDLGLERASWKCAWQVEINDDARAVLNKHWRSVPKHRDVRECGKHNLRPVRLIAGGFPCQDVSDAGKWRGIEGARSGLWSEYARIIGELRPDYALIENVTGLFNRGFERVICDLAALGYDAEWTTLRASDFGYPHKRERIFIVAYPECFGLAQKTVFVEMYQQHLRQKQNANELQADFNAVHIEAAKRAYVEIPHGLCVDDGVSSRLVRPQITGYGNAVVPDLAHWLGSQILSHCHASEAA